MLGGPVRSDTLINKRKETELTDSPEIQDISSVVMEDID
jgi:hypothetical protein